MSRTIVLELEDSMSAMEIDARAELVLARGAFTRALRAGKGLTRAARQLADAAQKLRRVRLLREQQQPQTRCSLPLFGVSGRRGAWTGRETCS